MPQDDATLAVYLNIVRLHNVSESLCVSCAPQFVTLTDYTLWKLTTKGG